MGKKYDAVIAVGEYTNAQGEKKKRYLNIGAVMESEHGPYLLLDSHILSMQVFALANKERRDSVLVSLFEPKGDAQTATPPAQQYDDIPY